MKTIKNKKMEPIENFEKYVDSKLKTLEEQMKAWRTLKLDLNVEAIKGEVSISSPEINYENNSTQGGEKPDLWPKKLKDQIMRIIEIENRSVKCSQIKKRLAEIEGDKKTKRMSALISSNLNALFLKKSLLKYQYDKDSKLTFYVKPEWTFEEEGVRKITPQHAPSESVLAELSEEQKNPDNIFWK